MLVRIQVAVSGHERGFVLFRPKNQKIVMWYISANRDEKYFPEPYRFDITRNHSGNIIFGAGPHLCIGLNLVKAQGKITIEEFERRFGDTAELVGDVEYDPMHFNTRRITTLMVRTGAS